MFDPNNTDRSAVASRVRTTLASSLDAVLELSVIGSFSRIGPTLRRPAFGWADPPPGALSGRTIAITGPTSGLGLELTQTVAGLGARVVLIGRSEARLEELQAGLGGTDGGADVHPVVIADMASLESVRAAVDRIVGTESRLDVLIDNAGAIHAERRDTPDGLEATFALMVVGPFALEQGLLPLLRRTPGSRVIAVTSGGMYTQRLPLDDLQYRTGDYSGPRAYARAKRAQVALMREWARRLRGEVAFAAMHPGWADTPGLADALPGFHRVMRPILRSAGEGIDTLTWLAVHPDPAGISGRLFLDRRSRPFDRTPSTRLSAADRQWLWGEVARLARRQGRV
jgi:NAD(P)-dependent dehydrogenase (short-subunit alcohol dehydrogenase family)